MQASLPRGRCRAPRSKCALHGREQLQSNTRRRLHVRLGRAAAVRDRRAEPLHHRRRARAAARERGQPAGAVAGALGAGDGVPLHTGQPSDEPHRERWAAAVHAGPRHLHGRALLVCAADRRTRADRRGAARAAQADSSRHSRRAASARAASAGRPQAPHLHLARVEHGAGPVAHFKKGAHLLLPRPGRFSRRRQPHGHHLARGARSADAGHRLFSQPRLLQEPELPARIGRCLQAAQAVRGRRGDGAPPRWRDGRRAARRMRALRRRAGCPVCDDALLWAAARARGRAGRAPPRQGLGRDSLAPRGRASIHLSASSARAAARRSCARHR
mmetsp:Transcript_2520/g.6719  ORF Transcript_2520/g.6719 Transcript_2520/m.6719 type:complete len:330 (-) Transcript_2520:1518-2507(-)